MIKRFAAALVGGACLVSASAAFAATTSAFIDVTATVTAYCSVNSGGSLNFGDLNRNSDSAATTLVVVQCNGDQSPTMTIRSSYEGNETYVMRRNDGNTLVYGVRADGANLGAGVPRQLNLANFMGTSIVEFPIEAIVNVTDALDASAGSYSDRLTVDITY